MVRGMEISDPPIANKTMPVWARLLVLILVLLLVAVFVLAGVEPIALRAGSYRIQGTLDLSGIVAAEPDKGRLFVVSEANASTDGFVMATEIKRALLGGSNARFSFVLAKNAVFGGLLAFMRLCTFSRPDQLTLIEVDFSNKTGTVSAMTQALAQGRQVIIFMATCRKAKCGVFHLVRSMPDDAEVHYVRIADERSPRVWGLKAGVTYLPQDMREIRQIADCKAFNDDLWKNLYGTTESIPCL